MVALLAVIACVTAGGFVQDSKAVGRTISGRRTEGLDALLEMVRCAERASLRTVYEILMQSGFTT